MIVELVAGTLTFPVLARNGFCARLPYLVAYCIHDGEIGHLATPSPVGQFGTFACQACLAYAGR